MLTWTNSQKLGLMTWKGILSFPKGTTKNQSRVRCEKKIMFHVLVRQSRLRFVMCWKMKSVWWIIRWGKSSLKRFGLTVSTVCQGEQLNSHETPINTILNDDDGHWMLETCWKRHFDEVFVLRFRVLITMMNFVAMSHISLLSRIKSTRVNYQRWWWTGRKSIRNRWWWWKVSQISHFSQIFSFFLPVGQFSSLLTLKIVYKWKSNLFFHSLPDNFWDKLFRDFSIFVIFVETETDVKHQENFLERNIIGFDHRSLLLGVETCFNIHWKKKSREWATFGTAHT